jgi:hypothetical protein
VHDESTAVALGQVGLFHVSNEADSRVKFCVELVIGEAVAVSGIYWIAAALRIGDASSLDELGVEFRIPVGRFGRYR